MKRLSSGGLVGAVQIAQVFISCGPISQGFLARASTHQHFALNDGLELLWFFAVASNRDRDARPLPTGVGFRYLESA